MAYLEGGRCSLSNNLSENSICPVTVGWKNWLFSDTPEGATANLLYLTIIEMAKAYDINLYEYQKLLLGHAIDEITRLTGHTYQTAKKYLEKECSSNNGHYDCRMPGKPAPYDQEVVAMRSQRITYKKIHERIYHKGYTGTIASLWIFMQKERTHQKRISAAVQTVFVEPAA